MLSEHFSWEEFTRSQTATRHDIDNSVPEHKRADAIWFCETILEPIRELVRVPVILTSGYRCLVLNQKIGGSDNSYHIKGRAADIVVPGFTPVQLAILISRSDILFDKLIMEFGRWVHIQGRKKDSRRQTLTAYKEDGKTHYKIGVHSG